VFCLADKENKKNEKEFSLTAMLLVISLLFFMGTIALLLNGDCTDYFSTEYSIHGFMTQFGLYLLIAIGTVSFYFASVEVLKLCRRENDEYKRIVVSIAFILFAYTAAFIQLAQRSCTYYYSKELTLFSLSRDYFPALLMLVGTCYLFYAIKIAIKLIVSKNNT